MKFCASLEVLKGNRVRFNDLMQTVLAAENRSGLGAVTLWRQCVDLLAQNDRADRGTLPDEERAALLDRLAALQSQLSETQRIATVVELGGRLRSPALVEFFANDRPAIAAAAMSRARLPDDAWIALLPRLTPTARGVLRGRRDLGAGTQQALEAFGAADLVLTSDLAVEPGEQADDMLLTPAMMAPAEQLPPSADVEEAPVEEPADVAADDVPVGDDQIRNLVDRIERFTSARRVPDVVVPRADTG